MVVIKKQFDEKGNLALQAVVEDGKIKSVRCFMPSGQELPVTAKVELFELGKDGMVGLKDDATISFVSSKVQKSLEEMYSDFKQHDQITPADIYKNTTGAVSGSRMVEEAANSLGDAMKQLSDLATTNWGKSLDKIKHAARNIGGGNEKAEGKETD